MFVLRTYHTEFDGEYYHPHNEHYQTCEQVTDQFIRYIHMYFRDKLCDGLIFRDRFKTFRAVIVYIKRYNLRNQAGHICSLSVDKDCFLSNGRKIVSWQYVPNCKSKEGCISKRRYSVRIQNQ